MYKPALRHDAVRRPGERALWRLFSLVLKGVVSGSLLVRLALCRHDGWWGEESGKRDFRERQFSAVVWVCTLSPFFRREVEKCKCYCQFSQSACCLFVCFLSVSLSLSLLTHSLTHTHTLSLLTHTHTHSLSSHSHTHTLSLPLSSHTHTVIHTCEEREKGGITNSTEKETVRRGGREDHQQQRWMES